MKKNLLRTMFMTIMIVASFSFVACGENVKKADTETTGAVETTTVETESTTEIPTTSEVETTTEEITTEETSWDSTTEADITTAASFYKNIKVETGYSYDLPRTIIELESLSNKLSIDGYDDNSGIHYSHLSQCMGGEITLQKLKRRRLK